MDTVRRRDVSPAGTVGNFVRTVETFRREKKHQHAEQRHTVAHHYGAPLVAKERKGVAEGPREDHRRSNKNQNTNNQNPQDGGCRDTDAAALIGAKDIIANAIKKPNPSGARFKGHTSANVRFDDTGDDDGIADNDTTFIEPFWRHSRSFQGPKEQYARHVLSCCPPSFEKTSYQGQDSENEADDDIVEGHHDNSSSNIRSIRRVNKNAFWIHSDAEVSAFDRVLAELRARDATQAFLTGKLENAAISSSTPPAAASGAPAPLQLRNFSDLASHFYANMFPPVKATERDEAYCLARAMDNVLALMPHGALILKQYGGQLAFDDEGTHQNEESGGIMKGDDGGENEEEAPHRFFQLDIMRRQVQKGASFEEQQEMLQGVGGVPVEEAVVSAPPSLTPPPGSGGGANVSPKPLRYPVSFVAPPPPMPFAEDTAQGPNNSQQHSGDRARAALRRTVLNDPSFLEAQQEIVLVLMLGWMEGIRQVYTHTNERGIVLEKIRTCFTDILFNTLEAARIYRSEYERMRDLALDRAVVDLQHQLAEQQIALEAALIDASLKQETIEARDEAISVLQSRIDVLKDGVAHFEAKEELRRSILEHEREEAGRRAASNAKGGGDEMLGGGGGGLRGGLFGSSGGGYTAAQIERFKARKRRHRVDITGKMPVGDDRETELVMKMAEKEHQAVTKERRLRTEAERERSRTLRGGGWNAYDDASIVALDEDSEDLAEDEVVAVRDAHVQVSAAEEEGSAEALFRELQRFLSEVEMLVQASDRICHEVYGTADVHDPSPMLRPAVRRLEALSEDLFDFANRAQHDADLDEAKLLAAQLLSATALVTRRASTAADKALLLDNENTQKMPKRSAGDGNEFGSGVVSVSSFDGGDDDASKQGGGKKATDATTNADFAAINSYKPRGAYIVPQRTHAEIMVSANKSLAEITLRLKTLYDNPNFKQGIEFRAPRHGQEPCALCKRVDPDPALLRAFDRFEALRAELRNASNTADKLQRELNQVTRELTNERLVSMAREDELDSIRRQLAIFDEAFPTAVVAQPAAAAEGSALIGGEGGAATGGEAAGDDATKPKKSLSLAMDNPLLTANSQDGTAASSTDTASAKLQQPLTLAQRLQNKLAVVVAARLGSVEKEVQTDTANSYGAANALSSLDGSFGRRTGSAGGARSGRRRTSESPLLPLAANATAAAGRGGSGKGAPRPPRGAKGANAIEALLREQEGTATMDLAATAPYSDVKGGGDASSIAGGKGGPLRPRPPTAVFASFGGSASSSSKAAARGGGSALLNKRGLSPASLSSEAASGGVSTATEAKTFLGGRSNTASSTFRKKQDLLAAASYMTEPTFQKDGGLGTTSSSSKSASAVPIRPGPRPPTGGVGYRTLLADADAAAGGGSTYRERITLFKSEAIAAAAARFGYNGGLTTDGMPRAPTSVIKLISNLFRTKFASDASALAGYAFAADQLNQQQRGDSFDASLAIPFPLRPFPEHVVQQLQRMFGTRRLIQQHTLNLLNAIGDYSGLDARVRLFGAFVTETVSLEACHWVLKLSNALDTIGHLYSGGGGGGNGMTSKAGVLAGDEDRHPITVPLDMILHACCLVFLAPHFSSHSMPRNNKGADGIAPPPTATPAAPLVAGGAVVGGVHNGKFALTHHSTCALLQADAVRGHIIPIMQLATARATSGGDGDGGDGGGGGAGGTPAKSPNFAVGKKYSKRTPAAWNHQGAIAPLLEEMEVANDPAQATALLREIGLPTAAPWCCEVPRAAFLSDLASYLGEKVFAVPAAEEDEEEEEGAGNVETVSEEKQKASRLGSGRGEEGGDGDADSISSSVVTARPTTQHATDDVGRRGDAVEEDAHLPLVDGVVVSVISAPAAAVVEETGEDMSGTLAANSKTNSPSEGGSPNASRQHSTLLARPPPPPHSSTTDGVGHCSSVRESSVSVSNNSTGGGGGGGLAGRANSVSHQQRTSSSNAVKLTQIANMFLRRDTGKPHNVNNATTTTPTKAPPQ